MSWFINGLAVQLENQRGMTGFQNIAIDVLVTRDTRIRAHIKVPQIVHAGADASRICPIGASMPAQPRLGRAVTIFARNAFIRTRTRSETTRVNRLKWRMTNGAASVRLRLRNANDLADSGGASVEQNRIGAGVKIFLRPGDVLAAFFSGATVATGRLATD